MAIKGFPVGRLLMHTSAAAVSSLIFHSSHTSCHLQGTAGAAGTTGIAQRVPCMGSPLARPHRMSAPFAIVLLPLCAGAAAASSRAGSSTRRQGVRFYNHLTLRDAVNWCLRRSHRLTPVASLASSPADIPWCATPRRRQVRRVGARLSSRGSHLLIEPSKGHLLPVSCCTPRQCSGGSDGKAHGIRAGSGIVCSTQLRAQGLTSQGPWRKA